MAYTDEELAQAGRQLAASITENKTRLDSLEARPTLDRMNSEWASGQAFLQAKGYSADEIRRVEDTIMVPRGIARHHDAYAVDPARPTGFGWGLDASGDMADWLKDPDGMSNRMIGKILSGG
jgi:hypothetical protein